MSKNYFSFNFPFLSLRLYSYHFLKREAKVRKLFLLSANFFEVFFFDSFSSPQTHQLHLVSLKERFRKGLQMYSLFLL